ncbi:MAG: SH3 domain-containing protein [Chloroflexota bacterium]|nr:SH3 domain-containing protein [Chloroflexota bacterium]
MSRIIRAWTRSGRLAWVASLLVGSVALAGIAACGESEPEATPTPAPTPLPIVTAPAMSPSPAPAPTPTPEPPPTATPTPRPTPTAQPAPRPVTPRPAPTSPAPTPEPTAAPTAATEAEPAVIVGVVLPEVGLNVRDAPSVDEGTVQYVALQGEELEVSDEISESDGVVWRRLADGNWVQVQYLEISETAPDTMTEATPEATPGATAEAPAQTIGVVLPEIGLNVRDAPSVADGAVQYVALQGEELVLTGQIVEAEGAVWYELDDGNWVQGQYLEFSP